MRSSARFTAQCRARKARSGRIGRTPARHEQVGQSVYLVATREQWSITTTLMRALERDGFHAATLSERFEVEQDCGLVIRFKDHNGPLPAFTQ